jgi:hypothetical protein
MRSSWELCVHHHGYSDAGHERHRAQTTPFDYPMPRAGHHDHGAPRRRSRGKGRCKRREVLSPQALRGGRTYPLPRRRPEELAAGVTLRLTCCPASSQPMRHAKLARWDLSLHSGWSPLRNRVKFQANGDGRRIRETFPSLSHHRTVRSMRWPRRQRYQDHADRDAADPVRALWVAAAAGETAGPLREPPRSNLIFGARA